jgi:hypothetical protein
LGKKSGSRMNIPDHFSESLETVFGLKILEFLTVFGLKILEFFDVNLDPESF